MSPHPDAATPVAQRIAQALPTLTRSHRRVADYVLAHPLRAAMLPIDEMAAAVGVSVATANRFARALRFAGYPQFRAALVLGMESTLAPVEKLRSRVEQPATAADAFEATLADVQRNVQSTLKQLDKAACEDAVKLLLRARRVFIIGYGSSSWLGGLLQRNLDLYCENVQLLSSLEGSSYAARKLGRLGADDVLVALCFPRYYTDTILLAHRAREAGVPVLALTDRVTSPLAPLATVALYAQSESSYFANSETTVLAVVEALSAAVAHAAKGSVQAATHLAEAVLPWMHATQGGRLRPLAPATTPARRRP